MLDEKIQGEKEETEEEEEGAEGEAALGKAADGVEEADGDYAQTRFGAREIKGPDGLITGKVATKS
jgi:hypothetical protein